MSDYFEVTCLSLKDTALLAETFANQAKDGCFISLYGEIGAGKTAFVKLVADALEVQEKVTSPSFVILNEYKSGKLPIYHFDLYRLENEGIETIVDELREYSEGKILTFVEWAEFSKNEIPFGRIEINVTYEDNEARKYTLKPYGKREEKIVEDIKNVYACV